MKRDFPTVLIGFFFIAAGIIAGGVILGFFNFEINLAGWWTIFIIAPALYAISQTGLNVGNAVLLTVGVLLLLNAQQVLPMSVSWRLIFPVLLLAVGVQILFGNSFSRKKSGCSTSEQRETGGKEQAHRSAFFSGQDVHYDGHDFTGATYSATFGAVTADLRHAKITSDIVIGVSVLFGGIEIILPENVKVVTHVVPVLGGVDCIYRSSEDPAAHSVIIRGSVTFGGVEVK